MSDEIETAERLARRIVNGVNAQIDMARLADLERGVTLAIEADRAAIRLDERRKVLREAAEWCEAEYIEALSRGAALAYRQCGEHFAALANKEPER